MKEYIKYLFSAVIFLLSLPEVVSANIDSTVALPSAFIMSAMAVAAWWNA